jgi:hypothetical protein
VIDVRMRQQNRMHVPEPRIGPAGNGGARVIKNANPGGILEQQRTISYTEVSGPRAQWCNFYGLSLCRMHEYLQEEKPRCECQHLPFRYH